MTIVREMMDERVRRVQVQDYVQKRTTRAGFGGLSIQRTPLGTHVRITAERPGLVLVERVVISKDLLMIWKENSDMRIYKLKLEK